MSQASFEPTSSRALLTALVSIDGIGAKTVRSIVNACRNAACSLTEFWERPQVLESYISLEEKIITSIQNFKKEHNPFDNLSSLEASGWQLCTYLDSNYPRLLLESDDYPVVLFVQSDRYRVGDRGWRELFEHSCTVVGTRHMTAYGRLVLSELLPPLVKCGYTITSGFMYGVDLQAGRLALEYGGTTIAVLGYGFNHCYPKHQVRDRAAFLEQGAVFLSEFPPDTAPRPSNFVMRNRIVAGLSRATLVIEAAARSGSHITASFANDYGRLVMAVPGPITNPLSVGTKVLVNQGAVLVTSAQDILQAMQDDHALYMTDPSESAQRNPSTEDSAGLLKHLGEAGLLSQEELFVLSGLSRDVFNQRLFDLELQGRISKQFGKYCLKL